MKLLNSLARASVTLAAATETDLVAATPCGDANVLHVAIKNLDVANAIDTVTVYLSPTGGLASALATTYSVAHGATLHLQLRAVAGVVRVTATSTSGASAQLDAAWYADPTAAAFQVVQDGTVPPPGAVGSLTTSGNVAVGGTLAVTGATTVAGLTASGDLAAAGGFRQNVGPFYVTTAASQTAAGTKFGDTAGQAWVAPRPGSVMGASGMIDAAVTGSGTTITARVYKALAASPTSFSLLDAAYDLAFTQAGGELAAIATAAKDAHAFAAGDLLKVVYTSTGISNTPKLVVNLEIEC